MKIEEYRYAAIIATAIIMLEMIDHFGHVLFDQDMDMLGNLATKSLKLLMLSIVTRKKQKIPLNCLTMRCKEQGEGRSGQCL